MIGSASAWNISDIEERTAEFFGPGWTGTVCLATSWGISSLYLLKLSFVQMMYIFV